jgi:hypothetical protein
MERRVETKSYIGYNMMNKDTKSMIEKELSKIKTAEDLRRLGFNCQDYEIIIEMAQDKIKVSKLQPDTTDAQIEELNMDVRVLKSMFALRKTIEKENE